MSDDEKSYIEGQLLMWLNGFILNIREIYLRLCKGYETADGISLRQTIDKVVDDSLSFIKKSNTEYAKTLFKQQMDKIKNG